MDLSGLDVSGYLTVRNDRLIFYPTPGQEEVWKFFEKFRGYPLHFGNSSSTEIDPAASDDPNADKSINSPERIPCSDESSHLRIDLEETDGFNFETVPHSKESSHQGNDSEENGHSSYVPAIDSSDLLRITSAITVESIDVSFGDEDDKPLSECVKKVPRIPQNSTEKADESSVKLRRRLTRRKNPTPAPAQRYRGLANQQTPRRKMLDEDCRRNPSSRLLSATKQKKNLAGFSTRDRTSASFREKKKRKSTTPRRVVQQSDEDLDKERNEQIVKSSEQSLKFHPILATFLEQMEDEEGADRELARRMAAVDYGTEPEDREVTEEVLNLLTEPLSESAKMRFKEFQESEKGKRSDSCLSPDAYKCCRVCGATFSRIMIFRHIKRHLVAYPELDENLCETVSRKKYPCGKCGSLRAKADRCKCSGRDRKLLYSNCLRCPNRVYELIIQADPALKNKPKREVLVDNEAMNLLVLVDLTKKHKEGRFGCPLCEMTFTLRINAKQHLRRHAGTSHIPCETCGQYIEDRPFKLRRHKAVCTGTKAKEFTSTTNSCDNNSTCDSIETPDGEQPERSESGEGEVSIPRAVNHAGRHTLYNRLATGQAFSSACTVGEYCPEKAWTVVDLRRKAEREKREFDRMRARKILDLMTESRLYSLMEPVRQTARDRWNSGLKRSCKICKEVVSTRVKHFVHILAHCGIYIFRCKFCKNMKFMTPNALKLHSVRYGHVSASTSEIQDNSGEAYTKREKESGNKETGGETLTNTTAGTEGGSDFLGDHSSSGDRRVAAAVSPVSPVPLPGPVLPTSSQENPTNVGGAEIRRINVATSPSFPNYEYHPPVPALLAPTYHSAAALIPPAGLYSWNYPPVGPNFVPQTYETEYRPYDGHLLSGYSIPQPLRSTPALGEESYQYQPLGDLMPPVVSRESEVVTADSEVGDVSGDAGGDRGVSATSEAQPEVPTTSRDGKSGEGIRKGKKRMNKRGTERKRHLRHLNDEVNWSKKVVQCPEKILEFLQCMESGGEPYWEKFD